MRRLDLWLRKAEQRADELNSRLNALETGIGNGSEFVARITPAGDIFIRQRVLETESGVPAT